MGPAPSNSTPIRIGCSKLQTRNSIVAGKLKDWARAIKRDVHAIYLAARDPRVPWYAKALALCVAGYALSPIDLIPDFIPVIGYLDDLIIVPLGIVAVVKLIPPEIMAEHRAAAAIAAERPMSRIAAAVIVFIWVASIALVGWLGYHYWQKLKLKTQTSASADALCFVIGLPHGPSCQVRRP